MGLSIDGLSSGLDTTALINSLMAVEAIPQSLIKNKAATVQTRISALQGLNSAVADLATKAGKLSDPKSLELYSASSSSAKVTTTVGAGAKPGCGRFHRLPAGPDPGLRQQEPRRVAVHHHDGHRRRRPGHHGHPAHFIS